MAFPAESDKGSIPCFYWQSEQAYFDWARKLSRICDNLVQRHDQYECRAKGWDGTLRFRKDLGLTTLMFGPGLVLIPDWLAEDPPPTSPATAR